MSNLRQCSFNPAEKLIEIEGEGGLEKYLLVMHRTEWFQTYLEEMGFSGSMQVGGPEDLIKDETGKIIAIRASLYINGELIASDIGDVDYSLDKPLSCAATKAKGRALASAGFGIANCGNDIDEGTPCDMGLKPESMSTDIISSEPSAEATPKMTVEEAKAMVINMGNYKGMTLGEIFVKDPDRIAFYADPNKFTNNRYKDVQEAAQIIMQQ